MNNDFNFQNEPQYEIIMSESERKGHKKIFSKICFAFFMYLVSCEVCSFAFGYILRAFAPSLLRSADFVILLNSVIQYLIAFPVLCLFLRSIPKQEPMSNSIGMKMMWKYLVVCMMFIYIGSDISSTIMTAIQQLLGRVPENSVNVLLDNTNIYLSVLIVGLIGPIFEELTFRKLFIDRLMPYGEKVAILLPAFMFGLFHGNLYQFFYAFLNGLVFSYIYVKTGKIIYTIALHMFVNLFCGVLPTLIGSMINLDDLMQMVMAGTLSEEYILANLLPLFLFLIYSYGMLAMVIVGIVVFFKNLRKITVNKGEVIFPKGTAADTIFFNPGAILLIAVCFLLMALNTFSV